VLNIYRLISVLAFFVFVSNLVSAAVWMAPGGVVADAANFTVNGTVDTQLGTSDYYPYVGKLSNENYDHDIYYKERSSDNQTFPLAFVIGDYVVAQSPQNMSLGGSSIGKQLSDIVVYDDQRVTFPNQWGNGIHLVYNYGRYSVKEEVKIDSSGLLPSASPGDVLDVPFKMRIYPLSEGVNGGMNVSYDSVNLVDDVTINNSNGMIELTDVGGNTIWEMPSPHAYDSNGSILLLNYSLDITSFGSLEIIIHVPYDWLNSNITYPVYIDPTWTDPSSDVVLTDEHVIDGSTGDDTYDGNIETWWTEYANNGNTDLEIYDWGIRYDMGTTYSISQLRTHMCWRWGAVGCPLRIGVVKVCDDAACNGESNLLSANADLVGQIWETVDFTDAVGRWVEVRGGLCTADTGATGAKSCTARANKHSTYEMVRLNEIDFYVEAVVPTVEQAINVNITSLENGSALPRGQNDGPVEDTLALVGDYTMTGLVFNSTAGTNGSSCVFYIDNVNSGADTSDLSGVVSASLNVSALSFGEHNFTLHCSNSSSSFNTTNVYDIQQWTTNVSVYNYRVGGGNSYFEGDIAGVNITFKNGSNNIDPEGAIIYLTDHTDTVFNTLRLSNMTRLETGVYYYEIVVPVIQDIRWKAIAIYDLGYGIINVSSSHHSDVDVDVPLVAVFNFTIIDNAGDTVLGSEVVVDRYGYYDDVQVYNFTLDGSQATGDFIYGDNYYRLVADTNDNNFLIIDRYNMSNSTLKVQSADFGDTIPSSVDRVSKVLASNAVGFEKSTLIFNKTFNPTEICSCDEWTYVGQTCNTTWVCNSTSDYEYNKNTTHFWFNVSHFSAYVGGGPNEEALGIWDDTNDVEGENVAHYPNDGVGFYANYTNSSGSPINGGDGYCQFIDNSVGSWTVAVNMSFNVTTELYQIDRSFGDSGNYNFNVSCFGHLAGYANLSAVDDFTISIVAGAEQWSQISWFTAESVAHSVSYGVYNASLSCSQTSLYFVEPIPIDGDETKINASTDNTGAYFCQNTTQGALIVTNDGSVGINVTAEFGQITSGVTPKVSYNGSSWESVCSGSCDTGCNLTVACLELNLSAQTIIYNLVQNSSQELWLWSDFNNVAGTLGATKGNLTTNAVKYT